VVVRSNAAIALIAVLMVAWVLPGAVTAGGKPGYDDIEYQPTTPTKPVVEDYNTYQYGDMGGKPSANAYGTNNWDQYMGDQYQYDTSLQYSQYGYEQYGQTGADQYGYDQYGYTPSNYPTDPNYSYGNRHQYSAPEDRGFFGYDFGRRFLVGTAGDMGGYVMRDAVTGDLDGRRVGAAAAAGGIQNFADYAGNYDRRNDAGARIASNAVGYGLGNVAYRGIAGEKIKGQHVAGGVVEGGIVGFGKYMGDEEPTAMNGLFWGGLTRFGGAMANRGISGDKMRGKDIGGEGLRALVGALGYMGGNEQ
jgi:hypothetical protein